VHVVGCIHTNTSYDDVLTHPKVTSVGRSSGLVLESSIRRFKRFSVNTKRSDGIGQWAAPSKIILRAKAERVRSVFDVCAIRQFEPFFPCQRT
jgi:hypothetical protein